MVALQSQHADVGWKLYEACKLFRVTRGGRKKLGMKNILLMTLNKQVRIELFHLCSHLLFSWRAFSLVAFQSITSWFHPRGKSTYIKKNTPF